jgi:hypothetical protein
MSGSRCRPRTSGSPWDSAKIRTTFEVLVLLFLLLLFVIPVLLGVIRFNGGSGDD